MSDTQMIKDKLDIVDVIGEYVQLKPAGTSHKGLCPFHNEKSPSFTVSRDRQAWYCFGCATGGDIFSFIQEIEGMEFLEALKHLANRAGVTLSTGYSKEVGGKRTRIKEVLLEAARFFHNFLLVMGGAKEAQDYVTRRGLDEKTLIEWHVGYIPDQWDLLTKYLLNKGCGIDDLVDAGLTVKREGGDYTSGKGFYDRFRGRIMFPIHGTHGEVVGFTGRVIKSSQEGVGKYLNTPQTAVFDKSSVIFGLHKAKKAIKEAGLAVLVEGQMDVITAHQHGMCNVVASSGTALTAEQITLLKRYTSKIAMAFDSDEAGKKAAKRGIDLAITQGLDVRIIQIPEDMGSDPDDCIRRDPNVWNQVVEQAKDVMDWYFSEAFLTGDVGTPKGRQAIANSLLCEIQRIPFAMERDHWIKVLADKLAVDPKILREDMKKYTNTADPVPKTVEVVEKKEVVLPKSSRIDTLVETLLSLGILYPRLWYSHVQPFFNSFSTLSTHTSLYDSLDVCYNTSKITTTDTLLLLIKKPEIQSQVDMLLIKGEVDFPGITEVEALKEGEVFYKQLVVACKQHEREVLQKQIVAAEQRGDSGQVAALIKDFQNI